MTATLVALTMTWLYHRVGEEAARARSALERAQQEEERARQKTETVRQLSVVLTGFLDIADPWGPDSDESREAVRELFAQSWRELLPELSHDKEARAALLMKVADLAESLRLHAVVIEASEEAAALFEELQGPDDLKLAEALGYMAFGHGLAGRSDLSVEQLRRALEIIERHEQEVDPELYNGTLVRLVDALPDVGAYDECEALSRRHLAVSKELFGEGSMEQLEAQFLMGGLLSEKAWREGKPSLFDESERYLRAALQSVETLFGEEHVSFSMALAELGKLAFRRGRLELAGERYAKSHAIRVREFGEDSLIAAVSSVRIARVLSEQGRHLEAEARARQAVDWIEAEKDEQTYALAFPLFLHGKILAQLKRFGEAEKQLLRAIAAAREVFSADHWETHRVEMELARVLAATGRVEEAEDLLISVLERNTGPDQGLIARAGNELLEEIRRSEAGAQNP
ncbi:MAG: tetratricopeptide repeat protein [Acidobacteriota bacterium]